MVTGQNQTSHAKVTTPKCESCDSHCCCCPASNVLTHLNIVISILVEVDCGVPPPIPHSVMLWDNISTVGSHVVYQCDSGYHSVGEGNVSVCTASGEWDGASLLCQGDYDVSLHN